MTPTRIRELYEMAERAYNATFRVTLGKPEALEYLHELRSALYQEMWSASGLDPDRPFDEPKLVSQNRPRPDRNCELCGGTGSQWVDPGPDTENLRGAVPCSCMGAAHHHHPRAPFARESKSVTLTPNVISYHDPSGRVYATEQLYPPRDAHRQEWDDLYDDDTPLTDAEIARQDAAFDAAREAKECNDALDSKGEN